jgi:pteridine reductase
MPTGVLQVRTGRAHGGLALRARSASAGTHGGFGLAFGVMPTALVTGGAIRVGRAIVLALARDGYDVIVHANRSRDAADALAREVTHHGVRSWVETADLARLADVKELAARVRERHPALDAIVHNAAAYEHVEFAEVTPERLEAMFRVNVHAPFFLTQGLLPALRAAETACIINITDMAVSHVYSTTHFFSHYLASKAALDQLTRAWALELGPHVRVNAVAPGPVAMAADTTAEQRQEILHRVPLKREGTVDEVARAVIYLLHAHYVTGQTVRVDGGLSVS